MNIFQSYKQTFKKIFDYKSRSNRKEYWTFVFITVGICGICALCGFVTINSDMFITFIINSIFAIVLTLFLSVATVTSISLSVRRLHDIDCSGWWFLITFIPLVGLLFLFIMSLLSGTPGENRFGTEPNEAYHTTPSTPANPNCMSIQQIYLRAWKKSFEYKSRSSRKEYWTFFLINSIFFTLTLLIVMTINSIYPTLLSLVVF